MKPPRLVLALLAVSLVAAPVTADAAVVVSDDAMYSVDLGAAHICFIEPKSLRSDPDCAGLDLADFPLTPVSDPVARLAYGLVRGEAGTGGVGAGGASAGGETRPVIGVVSMLRATSHATSAPDEVTAGQVGEESSSSLVASLPPGARLLPVSSKIAWGKNVPVVRTTLAVEGLEAGADAMNGHREVLTAVGGRYVYITVWSGSREHATELARLADAAAATTDLKPEGRPVTKLNPWPGRLLFFFGMLGLMLLRFRKKRGPAPTPPAP